MRPTRLLDDDGTASMATALMMSHHAFRRDLARFATALALRGVDEPLHAEWRQFRDAVHGHHHMEDTMMFPDMRTTPALAESIDVLSGQHLRMEPLLARGDAAFSARRQSEALDLIAELASVLDRHFDLEESVVVPRLRGAHQFPLPPDADLTQLADGFAWSSHGVATEVLEQLDVMLPASLRSRLPAAREAFDARCVKVWGTANAGATRTSNPTA